MSAHRAPGNNGVGHLRQVAGTYLGGVLVHFRAFTKYMYAPIGINTHFQRGCGRFSRPYLDLVRASQAKKQAFEASLHESQNLDRAIFGPQVPHMTSKSIQNNFQEIGSPHLRKICIDVASCGEHPSGPCGTGPSLGKVPGAR